MAIATGVVTVAQENRFQLALDGGGMRLFVVAHDAGIEPDQLAALQTRQGHIAVRFCAADGLIAAEARAIAELPS